MEGPREALEREMYWLGGTAAAQPTRTASELRERVVHLAQTLRRDAEQAAPWGDPGITAGGRWKRRFKIALHRLLRPISRRYDRIGAELATVAVGLAERLERAEADLRQLEDEVLALSRRVDSSTGPEGPGD